MARNATRSRGLRDGAAHTIAAALCVSGAVLGSSAISGPIGATNPEATQSVRLAAAVSSLNPADGGPGGIGGGSDGDAAPAPSKPKVGGGSSAESGPAPSVSHFKPVKPGGSESGPQLDRALPRLPSPSSGSAGASAPASAATPDPGGVGGWINKAFSMVGSFFGGAQSDVPGDKHAKPSAGAGAQAGDAPQVGQEPAKKLSVTGSSKSQNNNAPTPESIVHSVRGGVDKLIGSLIHSNPAK